LIRRTLAVHNSINVAGSLAKLLVKVDAISE